MISTKSARELELTKMHVFPFSLRQGTKAETLPNHIDVETKKERARRLLAVSKELELNYYNKYLNKEVEVLVEELYKNNIVESLDEINMSTTPVLIP